MSKDKSNKGDRTEFTEQSVADNITNRRMRLAHQIGRLLARHWLQHRSPSKKGKPASGDSSDDTSA